MSRKIDAGFAIVFILIMVVLTVATVQAVNTDVRVNVQSALLAPLEGKFPLQGDDSVLQGNSTKIQGN